MLKEQTNKIKRQGVPQAAQTGRKKEVSMGM
jgi:hypothetical protein